MYAIKDIKNKVLCGNSLAVLKELPDRCIDMVMCSPPYWNLRNYNAKGQLGLEPTIKEYVAKLCDIFDEVKRVLKDEGTIWINIGDTYSGTGYGKGSGNFNQRNNEVCMKQKTETDLPDKCLCQIPSRFAIEMTERGWTLRNEIVWHKTSCMPSAIKDRFTVDFEKIFFFSKNKQYYFKQQFEPYSKSYIDDSRHTNGVPVHKPFKNHKSQKLQVPTAINDNSYGKLGEGRNTRCVWEINPQPLKEEHFASYPEKLCHTPIKAGCPEGGIVLDPFAGAGTTCIAAKVLNRNFVGIELNPKYVEMANKRIYNNVGLLMYGK